MKYVGLPHEKLRPLPFYLAMEEFLARNSSEPELFFMWQVRPTVIFGRNQIIDNEVNVDYCRRHGIEMYRRRSGGGCVFADMSNIMFSYIADSKSSVATDFRHYTSMVVGMLRSLGLDASDTSRNDILIGDRKVSGNAFYHFPGRSIVHGTMLFDTDMGHMADAITPSKSKLESKGVASVRSRVTTLNRHFDMGIDAFKAYVRNYMCSGELLLSEADVAEIEKLATPYFEPKWIYGVHHKASRTWQCRLDGVGEIVVDLSLDQAGRIAWLNLSGDFFMTGDIDTMLINRLVGVRYQRDAIEVALAGVTDVADVIHGLSTSAFIDMLLNNKQDI